MGGQEHYLFGHLVLPRVFPVGQNVRCVFILVGQFFILVGHCPMSNRYFKACTCFDVKYVIGILSVFVILLGRCMICTFNDVVRCFKITEPSYTTFKTKFQQKKYCELIKEPVETFFILKCYWFISFILDYCITVYCIYIYIVYIYIYI